MIVLQDVTKVFRTDGVRKCVAKDVTLTIPQGRSVALLGRNGAGKSCLLRMIAGVMRPTSGRINVEGSVSWPVGFAGSFHGDLSGLQNTRFVARIHGIDSDMLVDFVRDFADLRDHFRLPVRTYSQGMRARLGFAMSMGIGFDTYLIDEVTSVGDAAFRKKSETMLLSRLEHHGAIVVSHNMGFLRSVCDAAILVEDGVATWFDQLGPGIRAHHKNMGLDSA